MDIHLTNMRAGRHDDPRLHSEYSNNQDSHQNHLVNYNHYCGVDLLMFTAHRLAKPMLILPPPDGDNLGNKEKHRSFWRNPNVAKTHINIFFFLLSHVASKKTNSLILLGSRRRIESQSSADFVWTGRWMYIPPPTSFPGRTLQTLVR